MISLIDLTQQHISLSNDYNYRYEDYEQLVDILNQHALAYYSSNNPVITDHEYDQLFDKLKQVEAKHTEWISPDSPTQRVGAKADGRFENAQHTVPLLSLENSYDEHDLADRDESISKLLNKIGAGNPTYFMEPKFDGISIELIYREGIFAQAITRGDGKSGEDITQNIKTIRSLPIKLPVAVTAHIRAEVVMPRDEFEKLNTERAITGEPIFANPRNACGGSLRQLDPAITAARGLEVYPYDILILEGIEMPTLQSDIIDMLTTWGFKPCPWTRQYQTINEVIETCLDPQTKQRFDDQQIEFDGIVIKVQSMNQCELLGQTEHHPRRAMAYKFPAQQARSKLVAIDFQVGRTGIITPVGIIEPVSLSGVTITNVSLHNFDIIKNKDIRLGDYVWIQRSGEVIPYVIGPVVETRDGSETFVQKPDNCPVCGAHTHIENEDEGGYLLYCSNLACPAQLKERLLHFVSRDCMDIEGVGDSIVELLVDHNIVHSPIDIYKIIDPSLRMTLKSFPTIGDKKIDSIISQLLKSKNNDLWRIINALGIRHIGKKTAQLIVQEIAKTMENNGFFDDQGEGRGKPTSLQRVDVLLQKLSDKQLLGSIHGIGTKMIESLVDFATSDVGKNTFEQLTVYGVVLNNRSFATTVAGPLNGVRFCVTGTFEMSRADISQQLVKLGGEFCENITKNVTHLIVGQDASSKVAKAEKNGIQIINGLQEAEKLWGITFEKKGVQGGLF